MKARCRSCSWPRRPPHNGSHRSTPGRTPSEHSQRRTNINVFIKPYLDVVELEGTLAYVVVAVEGVIDLHTGALHDHELESFRRWGRLTLSMG